MEHGSLLDGFDRAEVETGETSIFVRWSGSGAPLLLLHGFPQTHLMWHGVAPLLARRFTVVCADLRGYGAQRVSRVHRRITRRMPSGRWRATWWSSWNGSAFRGSRSPGTTVAVGSPIAWRSIIRAGSSGSPCSMSCPTGTVWERADARFTLAYWPWSLLAQPEPLPERLIQAAPEAVVDDALGGWGSPSTVFGPEVRAAYVAALRDPVHVHAICEEYRAAATLDRAHDDADRASGRRIECPLLALWSGVGPLSSWYVEAGGPLALWRAWGDDVQGRALEAGHFFPEEIPVETAEALELFFHARP